MIRGYVGDFGSGKTLSMVWDLMVAMYNGRHVISNTPIECMFDPFLKRKKYIKAEFIYEGDKFQWALEHRENCILAIDEAAVYLPNMYWNKLPPGLIVKWSQQRKYRTDFWYTSQVYGHSVKRLRDLTHIVYKCRRRVLFPAIPMPWTVRRVTKGTDPHTYHIHPKIPAVIIFRNDKFGPSFFTGEPTQKKYERYHWGTRILWPSQVRRVFRAFDTMFVIDTSAMMKVKGFEQPTRPDDPEDQVSDLTAQQHIIEKMAPGPVPEKIAKIEIASKQEDPIPHSIENKPSSTIVRPNPEKTLDLERPEALRDDLILKDIVAVPGNFSYIDPESHGEINSPGQTADQRLD